jgi:putative ABC transport system permease protein
MSSGSKASKKNSMFTFIKIAWRNIGRNRARSLITIAAIGIGLCALIFLKAFIDGADRQMVRNYTDLFIGHIAVHRQDFQKNMAIEKSIAAPDPLMARIASSPDILASAARVKDFVLASSSESSAGVLLLGVDPAAETNVTTLAQRLRRGNFLQNGQDDKILLGWQLAENLKVDLGDKVVLMGQGSDGSMAASAYEVAGILDAGSEEIDKGLVVLTLKAAQSLLVLDGKISEIVVKTKDLDRIDAIAQRLREEIKGADHEVLTWKDISPATFQWLQFDQVFTSLILAIVLVVVGTGILNTILMGVLERTREFGIMLALGTRPGQIIAMVAAESFFLGILGVLFGSAVGASLVLFFGQRGIDLSKIAHALNSFYIGSTVYTVWNSSSVLFYALAVLIISLLVSLVPAHRASRLTPVEAIRQI